MNRSGKYKCFAEISLLWPVISENAMLPLNLPSYSFSIRQVENKTKIFDTVRKRYVVLTPEEWVRQNFIRFLIEDRQIPEGLIGIEKTIFLNRIAKRYDIVVFNREKEPQLVVECKRPSVKIDQKAFEQAIRYNLVLNIRYVILTNGLQHFCFLLDYHAQTASPLQSIPGFAEIIGELHRQQNNLLNESGNNKY